MLKEIRPRPRSTSLIISKRNYPRRPGTTLAQKIRPNPLQSTKIPTPIPSTSATHRSFCILQLHSFTRLELAPCSTQTFLKLISRISQVWLQRPQQRKTEAWVRWPDLPLMESTPTTKGSEWLAGEFFNLPQALSRVKWSHLCAHRPWLPKP